MTTTTQNTMEIPQLPEPEADAPVLDTVPDDSGINWAEEAGEQGDNTTDDIVEAVEGDAEILAEPEHQAEGTAPVAPPAVAPVTEEAVAPVAPTVEAPAAPVAPVAAPVGPVEPFDQAKWEQEQLSGLEKLYAISPEDAEKLQTEPELILPKLAANMHMMATKSILTAMQAMIPDYVVQHNAQQAVEQEAKNAFYAVNPDLSEAAHAHAIMQVGKIFRAANPTAPREVAIKTIGDMVRSSLNMPPLQAANPAAQPSPAVINQPVQRPFTPARGGGQQPVKAPNMWDEFLD